MRLKYRIDKIVFIWYNSYKDPKGGNSIMTKRHKTPEENRRDELVQEVRQYKLSMEVEIRVVKRLQAAMSTLPEDTREYKDFRGALACGKTALLDAYRTYESKREELENHCLAYCLSGNNFIPAFELLQNLMERG